MNIAFTHHAIHRIEKRKILKEEVIDAIRYPNKTIKKHGEYIYQKFLERGKIEVLCEKTKNSIKVITVYWM